MTDAAQPVPAEQPTFAIQRLYIKDLSFESPLSPAVFNENLQPNLNLNIQTSANAVAQDNYEVVLDLTVTAKANDKTVFLVEIKQAGIFMIKDFPPEQLKVLLGSTCLTILFPYVREKISELVASGGFPQFYLAPINFEALYMQNQQQPHASETTH